MPELPPYVQAADFISVRAFVRGLLVDAVVLGWRGDRVHLTWKSDNGNNLGWVAATDALPCEHVRRQVHSDHHR